ncbi:MAG: glycine cleavage system aminomethyltransferase GcvT [Magnetococcales bacterium]|nr:glycine cleavage system aminomethyltransferase GcvT [Magnetococcales bacterium]
MKTQLHDQHVALGGRMVDFSGWRMPLHYGSQIKEHHEVRNHCGVFDVSHMGVLDIEGMGAVGLLERIFAGSMREFGHGAARYGLLLNERGGVVDDVILYRLGHQHFRMVVNAGTREKDISWIGRAAEELTSQTGEGWVTVRERQDLAMLAVQGPKAWSKLAGFLTEEIMELPPFSAITLEDDLLDRYGEGMLARTGYTGEDGFEVMLSTTLVGRLWDDLLEAGATPCGLGARDTLRLEAGFNLYGADMDEETNPFESGLAWTLSWKPKKRKFMGRSALEPFREDPPEMKRVGLILEGRGVLRNHQKLFVGEELVGEITSGGYSPTLEAGIALARVQRQIKQGQKLEVEMRGRRQPVEVVRPPFVRFGKSAFKIE